MTPVNLNNPVEVRNVGFAALKEALGTIGVVRFMQQFDTGFGDYTKEKQESSDISLEDAIAAIKANRKN